MEDVRTSENLEKEILEDARKKVERILKNGEKQASAASAEIDKKLEEILKTMESEFKVKMDSFTLEMNAALPLERKRLRIAHGNEKFESFLASFFSRLTEEEREVLLKKRLLRPAKILDRTPCTIHYSGLQKSTVLRIFSEVLPRSTVEKIDESKGFTGILLQAEHGRIRYRLTIEEIEDDLRENYRKEIFDALLKGKRNS